MTLTMTERIALEALLTRRRAIQQQESDVLREIEARVGLESGAIGKTHQVHADGQIVAQAVAAE